MAPILMVQHLAHGVQSVFAPVLRHYGFEPPQKSGAARRGFDKTRMETFSDGVFAVALTLLIVDLSTMSFPEKLSAEVWAKFWPSLVAWLASTAIVGMYWVMHHNEMTHIKRVDRFMLWLNLAFLIAIVLLPFSSRIFGAFPPWKEPDERVKLISVFVFGGNLILSGFLLRCFWHYAVINYFVTYDESDPHIHMTVGRNKLVPETAVVSLIVAFIAPTAAWVLLALVPLAYTGLTMGYAYHVRRPGPDKDQPSIVHVKGIAIAGRATADIIITVDGISVGDVDELHQPIAHERDAKPIPITLLRQTEKLELP